MLKAAITQATAVGYRVDGVGHLDGIVVSETAKTAQPVDASLVKPPPISAAKASRASAPTTPKE